MIKNQYLKELAITGTCASKSANKKPDVLKIQSWLNLFAQVQPAAGTATAIDGDFGSSTELAVKNFQKAKGLPQTGVVDAGVFSQLSMPLQKAFTAPGAATGLRGRIVELAHVHLGQHAYELIINQQANTGPWVRSYMDGNEGTDWFWCMGFVQAIIDQAASQFQKSFKTLMPLTYSCDVVAIKGIEKQLLITNKALVANPSLAKPGDIFLLKKSVSDWYHTGLIMEVNGDSLVTIEGNTNNDGSNNGNGVYKRTRNFKKQVIDVFSIAPLV
ncbi:peptidoglycan-binding domain-containing protein [Hufsiella ginkgonis]|uniref:Peptidoglycan-binding protein n=1 Tax=Hufsiella ginkgonis TaxID=2695274 RepID=A0A7K1Y012_9SPHI|nr:peptidoglycan-binding domain-containing protein [Hufsiella ginkgonis]MXV16563.1 peptidoglycan-binding protein [Hufsiella ginkgonis]